LRKKAIAAVYSLNFAFDFFSMPQNLELKASIASARRMIRIARNLRARYGGLLHQKDIYYRVPQGRLKLRIFNNSSSELIYYHRPDNKRSRFSRYYVVPIADVKLAETLCAAAFGRKTTIEKKRRLFLYKNARIHIDSVKNLGEFLEFEVVVKYGKQQARILLDFLRNRFGIRRSALVAGSYSDLLLRGRKHRIALRRRP
jgi:predicted adenylyl cyclase CyaB